LRLNLSKRRHGGFRSLAVARKITREQEGLPRVSSFEAARPEWRGSARRRHMGLGTILIIILIIALLGGFSGLGGGPFYGTGYYGGGGLGLVLIIVIILVVLGRI
jgi:hypothetical protein